MRSPSIVLIWRLNPTSLHGSWLVLDSRDTIRSYASAAEAYESIAKRRFKAVYTNTPSLDYLVEKVTHKIRYLGLTPYEYHYFFNLQRRWHPDKKPDDDFLDAKPIQIVNEEIMQIMKWLKRYHLQYELLEGTVTPMLKIACKPNSSFIGTANWLSRQYARLIPKGVVLDKHVYCTRWLPTHWLNTLQNGVISAEPQRNPALLKGLRHQPDRVFQMEDKGFLLVEFSKLTAPVDFNTKQQVWISTVELQALSIIDSTMKFTVHDLLTFDTVQADHDEDAARLMADDTLLLSVTHGLVLRNLASKFGNTWTASWWRSVERANWLSLYNELRHKYEVVLSGYGAGCLSFYCWHGEMAKICLDLQLRAGVLKQKDEDFDLELHDLRKQAFESEQSQEKVANEQSALTPGLF
ncbi:hypothetical protein AAFX24_28465 [Vibrio mediterranei]|uniref:hypothetical protein n=1 Tax=Vibrio mediterranei TaxID=689 RepID=UPI0038CECCEA